MANPEHASPPIERRLIVIRGKRVILDSDLAALYGVPTKCLNEQVKRNADRFPEDFTFQLTRAEVRILRSQIVTSSPVQHGGSRALPFVFTEHGAIQAANVLESPGAIQIGVAVVRAVVRLRQMFAEHKVLAEKLDELDVRICEHDQPLADSVASDRGSFC